MPPDSPSFEPAPDQLAPDWSVWSDAARALIARATAFAGDSPVAASHVVAALDGTTGEQADGLPTIAGMADDLVAGVRAAAALRSADHEPVVRIAHLLAGLVDTSTADADPTVTARLLHHLAVTSDPVMATSLTAVAETFDAPLTEMLRGGAPPSTEHPGQASGRTDTIRPARSAIRQEHTVSDEPSTLGARIDALLDAARTDALLDSLTDYFGSYTGRWFDQIGRDADGADRNPNVLTADDVVAVRFLSVDIAPKAIAELLYGRSAEITALLELIPTDVGIDQAGASSLLADDAPASRLWSLLCSVDGVGWVVANKLLAHKRPRLLPVYDSVAKQVLQPSEKAFWLPLHEALSSVEGSRRMTSLRTIRDAAQLPETISELRVLDVLAWLEGKRRGHVDDDGSNEAPAV